MRPTHDTGVGSPTLIFLHYFGGSRQEWRAVIGLLDHDFRCIAADAPGFGDAQDVDGFSVEEMTQQVLDLLRSVAPQPCVLVGHSMMGKVSMVAASRRPSNLCGLVLVAPSPLEAEPMSEEARATMVRAQESPATAREFFVNGAKRPLDAEAIRQGTDDALRANSIAWRRWPQSGAREDWSQAIPTLDTSTLLLSGEYDEAIPPTFQRDRTLRHLPNGRLQVIAGAAHLLPYEAPRELAVHIESFVSSLSLS